MILKVCPKGYAESPRGPREGMVQDRYGSSRTWFVFALFAVFHLDGLYSNFHQGRSSPTPTSLCIYHDYRAHWAPLPALGQSVRTRQTPHKPVPTERYRARPTLLRPKLSHLPQCIPTWLANWYVPCAQSVPRFQPVLTVPSWLRSR